MSLGLKKTFFHILGVITTIVLTSACSDMPKRWDPQAYSVKKGDTLYSIAWRYEKDFRQIAEWNNIHPPYAIFPGQRLVMQPVSKDGTLLNEQRPQVLVKSGSQHVVIDVESASSSGVDTAQHATKVEAVKRSHVLVRKSDTLYSIARREGFTHHQLARWNHIKSPYLLKPGQKLRLSPSSDALGQTSIAQSSSQPTVKPLAQNNIKAVPLDNKKTVVRPQVNMGNNDVLPTRVNKWHWPVKGRVVKKYKANDTSRKGIGIAGKKGQEINAAAGGTVVYSGNGLINYGNLIIIKHSHSFLSAYAHNKKLLVKEGESVKPGQAIAKIGDSGNGKPQLHFEIRRNGKPVNPLNYLPKT